MVTHRPPREYDNFGQSSPDKMATERPFKRRRAYEPAVTAQDTYNSSYEAWECHQQQQKAMYRRSGSRNISYGAYPAGAYHPEYAQDLHRPCASHVAPMPRFVPAARQQIPHTQPSSADWGASYRSEQMRQQQYGCHELPSGTPYDFVSRHPNYTTFESHRPAMRSQQPQYSNQPTGVHKESKMLDNPSVSHAAVQNWSVAMPGPNDYPRKPDSPEQHPTRVSASDQSYMRSDELCRVQVNATQTILKPTPQVKNAHKSGDACTSNLAKMIRYSCSYCGSVKASSSTGHDGRIRIRCECGGKYGGKYADVAPRMHAM